MVPPNQTNTHSVWDSPTPRPTLKMRPKEITIPEKAVGRNSGLEILKIFLRKTRVSLKKAIPRIAPKETDHFPGTSSQLEGEYVGEKCGKSCC